MIYLNMLRTVAGEGNFHIYRLLKIRRLFLFAKCLFTTISYFYGRGSIATNQSIAYIKGSNQLRYFCYAHEKLEDELGVLQLFNSSSKLKNVAGLLLPRFNVWPVVMQCIFLFLMLITGKRRYLNLYLINFSKSIKCAIDKGLPDIKNFVSFNDQPYDVAAIVYALNQRNNCRTIVIQHGLILSPSFYFPAVSQEFWAWGELSKKYFRSRNKDGKIIIKGRYKNDLEIKNRFFNFSYDRRMRILIAPSYFHDEIKNVLINFEKLLPSELKVPGQVGIKFHPATKNLFKIKWWIKQHAPWIKQEEEPMEVLSEKYNFLITRNSTSSIDFMLRGKLVFFDVIHDNSEFPSRNFCLDFEDFVFYMQNDYLSVCKIEAAKVYLKSAINV